MEAKVLVSLLLQGISLGMLYFIIASGLSLIFGLMDVLNLAHGSLFMWGAYVAMTVYGYTGSFLLALVIGAAAGAALGVFLEVFTIRRLYGNPISQVLLTLGLILVLDEMVKVIWGPTVLPFPKPALLAGSFKILGRSFPYYRAFLIALGAAVWAAVHALLTRTKVGLIIRAGVEDREMVSALGVDVRRVFTLVFALGGALAALGGGAAGPFLMVYPTLGMDIPFPALIVVVIGGLGSFTGSAFGALLVGVSQSFVGYYQPELAVAVNIALMAAVLLIKPEGLLGVKREHA